MAEAPLVIIGGGKMGQALLRGLLGSGWAADQLAVVEVVAAGREALEAAFPGVDVRAALAPTAGATLAPAAGGSGPAIGGAVIAVKPADVPAVCEQLAGVPRVLSIAAGVTLRTLEAHLPEGTAAVRAMPNTPALVGAGVAAIAGGRAAGAGDLAWAEAVLGAVGRVVRVPEHLLDAVTGLSGSGPAYVFLVAEALVDAGVIAGLPRDVSSTLALQTLLGAARLLTETGDGPEALRAAVTSPGGTTAAGIRALEAHGVRAAIFDAVMAATERSREIGRG